MALMFLMAAASYVYVNSWLRKEAMQTMHHHNYSYSSNNNSDH